MSPEPLILLFPKKFVFKFLLTRGCSKASFIVPLIEMLYYLYSCGPIRNFVFSPEVPIRIDYEGKHVDLTHGPLAGLLMGLGQLNCLQIRLKQILYKHGYVEFACYSER